MCGVQTFEIKNNLPYDVMCGQVYKISELHVYEKLEHYSSLFCTMMCSVNNKKQLNIMKKKKKTMLEPGGKKEKRKGKVKDN